MKAIILKDFGGSEMMVYGDLPSPSPSPGEVLIKVEATSVNRPDIVQRQGNYAPPKGDSEILGLEVAGTIFQTGEGVSQWKEGDRVMALVGGGGYAEYTLAKQGHVMAIPENMDFDAAACICETYITAYLNVFMLGGLTNGNPVLLHGGGGGVNTAAIQLCRALVPDSEIMVTASPKKIDRVKELGAHHVINYTDQDFSEVVANLTDKKGVQVILDHIGAKYFSQNMKSLSVAGTLMLIGVMGGIKAEVNLALVMVKRQRIIGSVLRSRSLEEKTDIIFQFSNKVLPLVKNNTIGPLIHQVFQLEEAAEAHRMMESSNHFGKIVLKI